MMLVRRINNDELYHHGIKGQRWGRKNGPPYPLGSLVSTGHRLRNVSKNSNPAKNAALSKSDQRYLNSKAHEQYKKLTPQQRNYKRIAGKVAKGMAITAGTALAAAAIYYGGNKIVQEYLGKTLRHSKIMRVSMNKIDDIPGRMYVTDNIFDAAKYKGLYTNQLRTQAMFKGDMNPKVYQNIMDVGKAKIAPNRIARKEFLNMYNNDKTFKNTIDKTIDSVKTEYDKNPFLKNTPQGILFKNARQNDKNLYDSFNFIQTVKGLDDSTKSEFNKYYKSLNKKGYQGIFDNNDIKYSGYKSKSPMILFDTKSVKSKTSNLIDEVDDFKNTSKARNILLGEEYVKQITPGLAVVAGAGAVGSSTAERNERLYRYDSKKNK